MKPRSSSVLAGVLLPSILVAALSCLTGGYAAAQGAIPMRIAQFGFFATDGVGGAGTVCGGFTCTPAKLTTSSNATLTFTIRAPKDAPYLLIVGPSAPLCVSLPGILNKWAVPNVVMLPGIVNQPEPPRGLRCFGWLSTFKATVPASAKGLKVGVQVVAEVTSLAGPKMPAFSTPIEISVR